MKVSCWGFTIIGFVMFTAGSSWIPDRGNEPDYWEDHSLVLARVVGTKAMHGLESVALQAIGTLSGQFDGGEMPAVTVVLPQKEFWHTAYPHTGDTVLVILMGRTERNRSTEGVVTEVKKYGMRGYGAHYMPDHRSPMAVVHSTSDPVVQVTLSAVQSLRAKPRTDSGKVKGYWMEHSLIIGRVEYYEPGIGGDDGPRIRLRPVATLSGDFDAATASVISVNWNNAMRGETTPRRPRDGDKVLLVLKRNVSSQGWDSPECLSAFMPGNHESMAIVSGASDPIVATTLRAVQALRREETAAIPSRNK